MAHRCPGCWFPPAVLDVLNVGVAKLAQALLQVLAEAAQGHLDDVNIAKQLLVHCAAENDQPGEHGRGRVVTWAGQGNLEGCLSSTAVPSCGATRTTARLLWVEEEALEGSSQCQCVQGSVELSGCWVRGHFSQAPATKLAGETPGPAGSHPPSSTPSLTPSNVVPAPWCSPQRAPPLFPEASLSTQEPPAQISE